VYDNLTVDFDLRSEAVPLLAGQVVNADQGVDKDSANEIIKKLPETPPNSYYGGRIPAIRQACIEKLLPLMRYKLKN
jgi:hypothetical protein